MIADPARRARISEFERLMALSRAPKPPGRPPADARRECAERCLRGDISQAKAASLYGVTTRTVERWVAWGKARGLGPPEWRPDCRQSLS
jgi:hypothetical protein